MKFILYCGCWWKRREIIAVNFTILSNWKEEAWKISGLQRDSNPWPPRGRLWKNPLRKWNIVGLQVQPTLPTVPKTKGESCSAAYIGDTGISCMCLHENGGRFQVSAPFLFTHCFFQIILDIVLYVLFSISLTFRTAQPLEYYRQFLVRQSIYRNIFWSNNGCTWEAWSGRARENNCGSWW